MNIILNDESIKFTGHPICLDIETVGLYGEVRLVQIYCPAVNADSVYVFDTRVHPLILIKKRIREASHMFGANLKYEFDCLKIIPDSWDDAYLLDTLINFREDKHSLDDIARRVHRRDVYKDMFDGKMDVTINGKVHVDFSLEEYDKSKLQKSDWGKNVLTGVQYAYAAMDVWCLPPIQEELSVEEAGWNYRLDKATVIAFAKMGQKLPIDIPGLIQHKIDNEAKIAEINLPINVNSYKQVRPYIGHNESGDDALALLCSQGNERACQVRTVRSLRKQISFINKFLEEKDKDGYIHGYLNVGTRSGRSRCSNMNLQQIPQAFKQYIKVHPGKFMVYADFAQLELRSLCVLIGEPILENLFRTGGDIHNYTKDALFSEDQSVSDAGRGNSLRQIAKIYNFASLYGAGWKTIGDVLMKYTGMSLTEEELKENKKKWLRGFPGIKTWHDTNIRHWQAKRTLSTPMGRKYIGKLPTDTNNIMNQGLGAEVAKLAVVYMDKTMDLTKFLIFVHDSYTSEYDTLEEAKQAAELKADSMAKAWKDITANCKIKDLDMPINCFVGTDWKTIDDTPIAEYELRNGIGEWK